MLLNKIARQPDQTVCCVTVYQIDASIKINECVKIVIYNWIIQHPQFLKYKMANDCLKLSIDGQAEPQLVPKFLFVSIGNMTT